MMIIQFPKNNMQNIKNSEDKAICFSHKSEQRGFSLLELLVVIVIVGIMASIALPSLSGMINQNKLTQVKNLLERDFNMARSEAIKSNTRYVVCPINATKTDCAATTNWAATGWWVCPASGTGCTTAASAVAIRPPAPQGIAMSAGGPAGTAPVTFKPIGTAIAQQIISISGAAGTTIGSVTVELTGAISRK